MDKLDVRASEPVAIATWSQIPDRVPVGVLVGNVDLVIVRYDDDVSVLYGRCLHRGAMLADALNNPHVARIETRPPDSAVAVFFIVYIAFVAWVLIAMFVAIVQDSYATSNYEEGISIKFEDIESFQRKWLEFDRENTSYMRTIDLGLLLYACIHAAAPECLATDER